MWARDSVVLSFVIDFTYKSRVGIDAAFTVEDDGIVAPGRFEELIHDFDVFFRDCVPGIESIEYPITS